MTKIRKPILVTGSHRSGTTWTGNMLSMAPRTRYIHEPFNVDTSVPKEELFQYWFQYVCKENEYQYREELMNLVKHRYPLGRNLTKARTVKDIINILKKQGKLMYYRARDYTPIIKDPIAVFSAAWLAETFHMNVIVLIRHPAAFCSSLKIKNWKYDFSHFLKQPLLMSRYLGRFEDDIREYVANKQDIVSQAILLWNCIHYTISIYQKENPEWFFVKHESLSSDPVGQFHIMYEFLGLDFTSEVKSAILESSGSHNPTEQESGSNEFVRNSKENILNWKNRLTQDEIQRIKEGTCEISELFYTESYW